MFKSNVATAEFNNILHLKSKNIDLANLLFNSKNAKLKKYAVRIKKTGTKIVIDDVTNNVKAGSLSNLRFDPLSFYDKKTGMILNLTKNIGELQSKHDDTIFLSIIFPKENCHVSQISRTISNLNRVWSLFISSSFQCTEIQGFFKYINIKESNARDNDNVDINIYAILHVNASASASASAEFLNYVNDEMTDRFEFYRQCVNDTSDNENYDCHYSVKSFEDVQNSVFINDSECSIDFYDLSLIDNLNFVESFINQTHNKKLISYGGTMMNYHY